MKYYLSPSGRVIQANEGEREPANWIFCISLEREDESCEKMVVEKRADRYGFRVGSRIFERIKSRYLSIPNVNKDIVENLIMPCLESLVLTPHKKREFYINNQEYQEILI